LQTYFSLKFYVKLKWRDDRLLFLNVHEDHLKNSLPYALVRAVWSPLLMFSNHIEKDLHKQILSRDGITNEMFIVKEGPGMESDLSFIDEGKVYGPEEASLLLVTEHFLKFSCNFDLNVFPFDKQTCQVQVRE